MAPAQSGMVTCPFLGVACIAIPMALLVRVIDLLEAEDCHSHAIVGPKSPR
jgi:hypothetical protein